MHRLIEAANVKHRVNTWSLFFTLNLGIKMLHIESVHINIMRKALPQASVCP